MFLIIGIQNKTDGYRVGQTNIKLDYTVGHLETGDLPCSLTLYLSGQPDIELDCLCKAATRGPNIFC